MSEALETLSGRSGYAQQAPRLLGVFVPWRLQAYGYTLAAAYAENKEFNRAVETAQRALQLARAQNDFALCDALQQEIHLYEAGLPYQQQ